MVRRCNTLLVSAVDRLNNLALRHIFLIDEKQSLTKLENFPPVRSFINRICSILQRSAGCLPPPMSTSFTFMPELWVENWWSATSTTHCGKELSARGL